MWSDWGGLGIQQCSRTQECGTCVFWKMQIYKILQPFLNNNKDLYWFYSVSVGFVKIHFLNVWSRKGCLPSEQKSARRQILIPNTNIYEFNWPGLYHFGLRQIFDNKRAPQSWPGFCRFGLRQIFDNKRAPQSQLKAILKNYDTGQSSGYGGL